MRSKAVFVLLILLAVLFLACGCAESFTFTYYVDEVNAVHREYRLKYDAQAFDADVVRSEAERVLTAFAESNEWQDISEIDSATPGIVELRVVYPSLTDYYIAMGYTGREANEPLETENHGLFVAYKDVSPNLYSTETMDKALAMLGEGYDREALSLCDYYYVYGTKMSMTESNADSVQYSDGIYYHTWKLTPETSADIVITQYSLNGVLVYSLIISVFVLSLIAIFVIIYITNEKNKKKFRYADLVTDEAMNGEEEGAKDAGEQ